MNKITFLLYWFYFVEIPIVTEEEPSPQGVVREETGVRPEDSGQNGDLPGRKPV